MDSIIQVNSGEVIIMGGLMEDRVRNTKNGVPVLEDTPLLGFFASGREDEREVTELVILLKATLLESSHIHIADQRLYNTFTQDPRPFL